MESTHDGAGGARDREDGRQEPQTGQGAEGRGAGDGSRRSGEPRQRRRRHRHWGPKERVLHTRVSQQLSEDIRKIADELRVPVSNLVRNVLEEAFSVVETVTDNVGELIEDVVEEAEAARSRLRHRRRGGPPGRSGSDEAWEAEPVRAPRAEFSEVLGWQPLVLNREQSCADCEEPLERGERGFVGATATGFGSIYLCADCVEARRG